MNGYVKEMWPSNGLRIDSSEGIVYCDNINTSPSDAVVGEVYETEEVAGWFGWWTMPGYMDRFPEGLCFAATKEELSEQLDDLMDR